MEGSQGKGGLNMPDKEKIDKVMDQLNKENYDLQDIPTAKLKGRNHSETPEFEKLYQELEEKHQSEDRNNGQDI